MKLVDANVLLYAINADSPHHQRARRWLEDALASSTTIGFSWHVILAFLRLSTKRSVFPSPLKIDEALSVVDAWLDQPSAALVTPGARHWAILKDLVQAHGVSGNLTSDAHLAALAIEHNAELCSTDYDFSRFQGLRWTNPLDS